MEKPISLQLDDLRNTLVEIINSSKLPPCLIKPIVKEIYDQINILYVQEIEKDRKTYDDLLNKQNQEIAS